MTESSERIEEFVRLVLLSLAGSEERFEERPAEAAERAFDGLRGRLGKVLGSQGYRAMVDRCLTLVRRDVHWLDGVQAGPDGSLIGLQDAAVGHDGVVADGFVPLLAQFLGLLSSLIGEELTGRLLYDVWPDVPFGQSTSGTQEMDE